MNYSLENVFNKQRELMMALEPVEASLGYTPMPVPLDFTQRAHQDWFRLMSWYLVEELTEFVQAPLLKQPEELADCLHFAVVLCILADVRPSEVDSMLKTASYYSDPPNAPAYGVITRLGVAVNGLKAKHWKKNPKSADLGLLRYHLCRMMKYLLDMFEQRGLNYETEYMRKHQINNERIENNY